MPADAASPPALPRATPETDAALTALLGVLDAIDYQFVTPTPATHARVLRRADKRRATSLRDVFGWSLPFEADVLDPALFEQLRGADVITHSEAGFRSRVRVSSLGSLLFLHSPYPTDDHDAVFLGPDSYRFSDFIARQLEPLPERPRIVDIGAGAGVGGIVAGKLRADAEVWLTDVNAKALHLAEINAAFASVAVTTCEGPGLSCAEGAFDAALINPPYIIDNSNRAYRDGGALHGAQMALDLALEAAERLNPGGRLLLYTGAPVVDGRDELKTALEPRLRELGFDLHYEELDPDVFGEELERPEYADVERITLIGAVAVRRDR